MVLNRPILFLVLCTILFYVSTVHGASTLGKKCTVLRQLQSCKTLYCNDSTLTCQYCSVDADCQKGRDTVDKICHVVSANVTECIRKKPFPDFSSTDVVLSVIVVIIAIFCGIAGIGGGGLFISLFLFLGWGKDGLEMSVAIGAGIAFAMYMMLIVRRHPTYNRPMIDYNLVMLMQPLILSGTIPGTLLKRIFPAYFLYGVLSMLLFALVIITLRSFLRVRRQDLKARAERLEKEKEQVEQAAKAVIASDIVVHRPVRKSSMGDQQQSMGNQDRKAEVEMEQITDYGKDETKVGHCVDMDTHMDDPESIRPDFDEVLSTDPDSVQVSVANPSAGTGYPKPRKSMDQQQDSNVDSMIKVETLAEEYSQTTEEMKKEVAPVEPAVPPPVPVIERTPEQEAMNQMILKKEALWPWRITIGLIIIWLAVFLTAAAKESQLGSVITCGSAKYYGVMFFVVGILWIIALIQGTYLIRRHRMKVQCKYEYMPGDVQWTLKKMRFYPLFFFCVGLLAATLGVPGGFLMGPILLTMGVHPIVSSANTAIMTFYTSSSSSVQYLITDPSRVGYFGWFALMGLIGGFMGRLLVFRVFIPRGITFWIVGTLMLCLAVNFTWTFSNAVRYTVYDLTEGFGFTISPICS